MDVSIEDNMNLYLEEEVSDEKNVQIEVNEVASWRKAGLKDVPNEADIELHHDEE